MGELDKPSAEYLVHTHTHTQREREREIERGRKGEGVYNTVRDLYNPVRTPLGPGDTIRGCIQYSGGTCTI